MGACAAGFARTDFLFAIRLLVGRTPWSAADAPVGLLALYMMLTPLIQQRTRGVRPTRPQGSIRVPSTVRN